jgi:hypothetical protein
MFGKLLFFLTFSALLISCGHAPSESAVDQEDMIAKIESLESALSKAERVFLDNIRSLCGKSFRGRESYSAPGRESWAGKDFVIHVTVCEDDRVHIPFHLDDDRSRTWMFLAEEKGLRFRHDHRHEDGTPEDLTLYGGYGDGTGTGFMQKFPADDYTIELLEDVLGREWRVILSDDMTTFTYELHYSGNLMFSAQFDLTEPV